MALRVPEHDKPGWHAYYCPCSGLVLVRAEWDASNLRCPYCTERLVEPVITVKTAPVRLHKTEP